MVIADKVKQSDKSVESGKLKEKSVISKFTTACTKTDSLNFRLHALQLSGLPSPLDRGRAVCNQADADVVRHQHGFTLLEIMVVVILIALTVSLVGVNLGRDLDQVAELEAYRFARLVEHARDESILSGKVYAIEVDEKRKTYQFFEASQQWLPVTKDDILRPRHFPEYLPVRFDLLQRRETGQRELLVVQGIGEITPFRLTVEGDKFLHVVRLDESLNIKVDQVNKGAI